MDAILRKGTGTILVIDDEPAVRDVSKLFLEQNGFQVLAAEDGMRALKLYEEHAPKIVLVLLDMTMPGMNGDEVYRALRGFRSDLPIILSSGYSEQEAMQLLDNPVHSSFIKKPYRPKALLDKVCDFLDSRG